MSKIYQYDIRVKACEFADSEDIRATLESTLKFYDFKIVSVEGPWEFVTEEAGDQFLAAVRNKLNVQENER